MAVDPLFRRILAAVRERGWYLLHFERGGATSYWGGSVSKQSGERVGTNRLGEMLMDLAKELRMETGHAGGDTAEKPGLEPEPALCDSWRQGKEGAETTPTSATTTSEEPEYEYIQARASQMRARLRHLLEKNPPGSAPLAHSERERLAAESLLDRLGYACAAPAGACTHAERRPRPPRVAIVGGGIGGAALALGLQRRGNIIATVYERDSGFAARAQGYGLTMQCGDAALEELGLAPLPGISSTAHFSFLPDGKVIGAYGRRMRGECVADFPAAAAAAPAGSLPPALSAGSKRSPESCAVTAAAGLPAVKLVAGPVTWTVQQDAAESSAAGAGSASGNAGKDSRRSRWKQTLKPNDSSGAAPTPRHRRTTDVEAVCPGKRQNAHIPRERLRQLLHERLHPGTVRWGRKFVRYHEHGDGAIQLVFDDGTSEYCDVLVGADGIFSAVRKQRLSHETADHLRYLGVMVILGIAPCDFPDADKTVCQTVDGDTRIFTMPFTSACKTATGAHMRDLPDVSVAAVGRGTSMWQLSFPTTEEEARRLGSSPKLLRAEALRRCGTWHAPIPDLLRGTDFAQVTGYPVFDRPLLTPQRLRPVGQPKVAHSCVTLLGDAAHPMSPFKGQGANQALLDGVELARVLDVCYREESYGAAPSRPPTPSSRTQRSVSSVHTRARSHTPQQGFFKRMVVMVLALAEVDSQAAWYRGTVCS